MKSKLLLIFLSLFFGFSNAQNCTISDSLSYIYKLSATRFVYENIRSNPQDTYYDSIYIPQQKIDEFLFWISAIWEQSAPTEHTEIFYNTKWELSGEKYKKPFDLIIEAPLNSTFMDTLNVSREYSGLIELDSLITLYNLDLKEVKDLSNSTAATFTSQENIFYQNIVPYFSNINQITATVYTESVMNLLGNCNGDILVVSTNMGDTVTLQMTDKNNPSEITSYWTYFIDNNCQTTFISKSVGECKELSDITELNYNFKLYPNPVQDKLYINVADLTINNISIINILGETIENTSFNISGNILQIDVSNIEKGIYFIKINDSVTKFLKK